MQLLASKVALGGKRPHSDGLQTRCLLVCMRWADDACQRLGFVFIRRLSGGVHPLYKQPVAAAML